MCKSIPRIALDTKLGLGLHNPFFDIVEKLNDKSKTYQAIAQKFRANILRDIANDLSDL